MQWGEEWGVPGEQEHGWGPVPAGGCGHMEGIVRPGLCLLSGGGLVEEEGLTILDLSTSYYSSKLPLMAR